MVSVFFGSIGGELDGLAGQSVGQIRSSFSSLYNKPEVLDAGAQLNGRSVDNQATVSDDDELQFVKTTAQKG